MTITSPQFVNIAPYPNGTEYSEYPLGNNPAPVWTEVPNFIIAVGTTFTVNLQSLYCTPTSGGTFAASTSLPAGWSLNTSTGVLTRADTGTAGAAVSMYFTDTVSGTSANSNTVTVQSIAASGLTAPRFGFVDNSPGGTSPQYPQSRAQRIARGDSCLMVFYAGIGANCYGGTLGAYNSYINTLNPNFMLFPYFLPDTQGSEYGQNGEPWPDLTNAVNANAWTVYTNWPGRSGAVANYNSGIDGGVANSIAAYTNLDGGLGLEAWAAEAFGNLLFNGTGSSASTDKDTNAAGVWHDNYFQDLPVTGDYEQNGGSEGPSSPPGSSAIALTYRQGLETGRAKFKALFPNKFFLGNLARWGLNTQQGGSYVTGFGTLDGGLIETLYGISYSSDTFGGGASAKAQYDFCMANTAGPTTGLVMIGCCWDSNGQDYLGAGKNTSLYPGSANWQAARYQVCCALQNDAQIWIASPSDNSYTSPNYYSPDDTWLDELCVVGYTCQSEQTPQTGKRYLGTRTNGPWYQLSGMGSGNVGNGVYATTYSDGTHTWVVFVNFSSNAAQTITVANLPFAAGNTHLQKLSGTQSSVNNGAQVTSFTIGSRDGLIGYLAP
jgi:hypothetical protein